MPNAVLFTRRLALAGLALSPLAAAAAAAEASAVPVGDLMAEGPLRDVVIGAKDAPVTIVEYASMTCPHCARFQTETFPALKAKYIDTGKAKYILREFPLDPLATAGFMLMRCAGDDKREALADLLFAQQKQWAYAPKPVEGLASLVKQAGISQSAFEACLSDKKLYGDVNATRDRASDNFHVDATPTFFINGTRHGGELTIEELSKVIDPMLP
jgi:protein-disulfide isomerase